MATRGVVGFIQKSEFKGFLITGAMLPYFLEDVASMMKDIPDNFDINDIDFIDGGYGTPNTREYELNCLMALRTNTYLDNTEGVLNSFKKPVSLEKGTSSYLLNRIDKRLPDASFRPLDGLVIDTTIVVNFDRNRVDIYQGELFRSYPELKYCANGDDFEKLAISYGQHDNKFIEMYKKHYVDFKENREKLRNMTSSEKRAQDRTSKEWLSFITQAVLFDSGPIAKIASIHFSLLRKCDESGRIFKKYLCYKSLGEALIYHLHKNEKDDDIVIDNDMLKSLYDIVDSNIGVELFI